eukprot:SAG11_NODE_13505_length_652_cov_1.099458_2_plen_94_part_01
MGSTVERLLLSGNQLETIEGLVPLKKLLLVDLSANSIQSVKGLENHPLLIDIFLKDNCISGDLSDQIELLKTLPLLRTLHMQNNPVRCIALSC